jgi:hypothetical protein
VSIGVLNPDDAFGDTSASFQVALLVSETASNNLPQLARELGAFLLVNHARLLLDKIEADVSRDRWVKVAVQAGLSATGKSDNDAVPAVELGRAWQNFCTQSNATGQFCTGDPANPLVIYKDSYDTEFVLVLVCSLALVLGVISVVVIRRGARVLDPIMYSFVTAVGLLDLSSDITFVSRCFSTQPYYSTYSQVKTPALVFLVTPLLANSVFVVRFVVSLMNVEANQLVISQNLTFVSIISLLSILHTELLGAFGSFITAHPITCLTLSETTKLRLKYSGLISNLLEDLPQFCIQVFVVVASQKGFYTLSGMSAAISALSLFIGLFRRILAVFVVKKREMSQSCSEIAL